MRRSALAADDGVPPGAGGDWGASEGQRPVPRVFERYWYHAPGLHGSGNAAPLDCPVLMDRDADGDGVFERRRGYLQDRRGA